MPGTSKSPPQTSAPLRSRIMWLVCGIAFLALIIEAAFGFHSGWIGIYAVYGIAGSVIAVFGGHILRVLVMRPEDADD